MKKKFILSFIVGFCIFLCTSIWVTAKHKQLLWPETQGEELHNKIATVQETSHMYWEKLFAQLLHEKGMTVQEVDFQALMYQMIAESKLQLEEYEGLYEEDLYAILDQLVFHDYDEIYTTKVKELEEDMTTEMTEFLTELLHDD